MVDAPCESDKALSCLIGKLMVVSIRFKRMHLYFCFRSGRHGRSLDPVHTTTRTDEAEPAMHVR